ncbi:unnamed protein product [Closterium sp. NIES-53]
MYLMTCTRPAWHTLLASWHAITSGMGLVLGGRSPVVLTGHADASWVNDLATQRSSQGYTFSLGSGSVSWRSTRSSSVLSSSCEAEIYAGAMAAQELRWLTYLLTDLGEPPRSPPVLMKHIALRYFLARELQQCGQLRLAYVASQANIADIFTKVLQPCDHQRFCSMLDKRAHLTRERERERERGRRNKGERMREQEKTREREGTRERERSRICSYLVNQLYEQNSEYHIKTQLRWGKKSQRMEENKGKSRS